ncbi:type III pantothenate kinase [Burkholderiales bacterium]|nr:type III pantothenate kinase [Burkholderiales bacterium]
MILVVHIGASRMKWGLHGARGWLAQGVTPNAEIGTLALREWQNVPRPRRAVGVNAAGEATRVRTEAQLARWRVPMEWIVPAPRAGGVVNGYTEPSTLSPVRWASLIAARRRALASELFPPPCVVVNAGTIISVDALDADGVFRGGLVLPGLHAMLRSLADASPSWRMSIGHWRDFPSSNSDAAATGVLAAAAGAIEQVRERLRRDESAVRCYVSGGAAHDLEPHLAPPVEVVDNLVLEGALALAEAA